MGSVPIGNNILEKNKKFINVDDLIRYIISNICKDVKQAKIITQIIKLENYQLIPY